MKLLNIILATILITIYSNSFAAPAVEPKELKLELSAKIINDIYGFIERNHVDEVKKQEVFENAIKGMLSGLDPHSDFLKPKEQKKMMEHTSGKFGGIGIVISKKDDFIEIISPIDDTPGYKAGLKSGDLIVKINDKVIRKMSLEDSVVLMRGKPGTKVRLTISRKNKPPFEVKIVRDIITIVSAKGYLLDKDLAYIRISSFQAPTASLVIKTLEKLTAQNKKQHSSKKLKSIIVDLRNNPGGLIDSSVDISDIFLPKDKLVVYTKGKKAISKIEYLTKKDDLTGNAKIVVLVNQGSASASEIVSGALQDHKRAVIVGSKTFGKGSVQSVIPIRGGYGIKITIARYYTPNDRSIQAKGIIPDVELEELEIKEKNTATVSVSVSERDLENHLEASENDKNNTREATIIPDKDLDEIDRLKQDYFIRQATSILKVLNLDLK